MTLTSCGIRPTPVLTGGEGPTVSSRTLTIYLVRADGDGLVRRDRDHTGSVDITTAINLLLAGPTDDERKQGLTTDLPETQSRAVAARNLVVLPGDVNPLASKWGLIQIHCTAQANGVEIAPDAKIPAEFCP
ncbi:hypothetical protein ACFWNN_24050 [Lentzea sp. NPDC058450]|uniref:hypothetical protein n=1 Tax=Lentzea sp. NPDC058450 TaxID=3346505 RepID=UPI003658C98B